MTIKVTVETFNHRARVTTSGEGHDAEVDFGPNEKREFHAFPGKSFTVEELEEK